MSSRDNNKIETSQLPSNNTVRRNVSQEAAAAVNEPSRGGHEAVDKSSRDQNCASFRRVHRIAPLFGRGRSSSSSHTKREDKQIQTPVKEIKGKTKSPIRISLRPIPGRNFDGFLDIFVKSN